MSDDTKVDYSRSLEWTEEEEEEFLRIFGEPNIDENSNDKSCE